MSCFLWTCPSLTPNDAQDQQRQVGRGNLKRKMLDSIVDLWCVPDCEAVIQIFTGGELQQQQKNCKSVQTKILEKQRRQ
jgi:hypothetical protein